MEKVTLKEAQERTKKAVERTNKRIDELGANTKKLYNSLAEIQEKFDRIRNVPSDTKREYEKYKMIRLEWKQQVEKIEKDYQNSVAKNVGSGAAGASLGVAVVTMAPTVAMGAATAFGVASTGTAISALSGAAATNAALAWLGGGALAAGGGGMVAGQALLALAGPVGWAIAGLSVVASGIFLFMGQGEKNRLDNIYRDISLRDEKSYSLADTELEERIKRIIEEREMLRSAIDEIQSFGLDYNLMTEAQQYELGCYVNLMNSSTQLLTNPIKGLQPNYTAQDLDRFRVWRATGKTKEICEKHKDSIISLSNLLYKIELNTEDSTLLWNTLRKNTEMLKTMNLSKDDFDMDFWNTIRAALKFKDEKVEFRR
ncbi:hypothetical protein [uncultured Abiotrophia sp.]|uniref:hypothetical protein n=1 Tax=uncultured Abiotrophia sp. TaxID=316094 RepID=UPI0028D77197|nr:hypothetical protein [uncultured Abiotrophia sp.]